MATNSKEKVDYRLLNRLNKLVICSRCLRAGRVTPIPQVLSSHHRLRNVCDQCLHETGVDAGLSRPRKLAAVVRLRP
jgi:superfamily II helicase